MVSNTLSGLSAFDLVSALYQQVLGREPDPTGLAHYSSELEKGLPLGTLLAVFLESDEYQQKLKAGARRLLGGDGVFRDDEQREAVSGFPIDYAPAGEAGRSYRHRVRSGFLDRFCSGSVVLDIGYSGYDNPENKTSLPNAIGIDVDYPGYDGRTLPFADESVDTVFSSHCLEHITYDHHVIRDWYRVTKLNGFIVCIVPSQALYEKKRFLPSNFNEGHVRMYTPSSLLRSFEEALDVNSYRVRHVAENDRGFNYQLGPDRHSDGAYEIELVVEKIKKPSWDLA